jgi:hypothetical protein
MDATIRATCPSCSAGLKIPAKWAGQAVKCKKCGAVVRTKAPADTPAPAQPPLELPPDNEFAGLNTSRPAAFNPFDPDTGGVAPPPPHFDPAAYYGPPPGYPYPIPPGYGPSPGYPYPMPPGYGPPPGYPYPMPPGYPYPVPPGYGPPPGYPHPAPYDPAAAGYPPPPASYDPAAAAAAAAYQAPAPVPPPPAPVPESVNGFKPGKEFQAVSAATASHSRGKGYQRAGGSSKAAWIGVAIVLAVGLVGGVAVGVPYFKKLKEQANNNPNNPEPGVKGNPIANPGRSPLVTGSAGLPRRLLFIQVSNYLYLNPLTSAQVVGGSKGMDQTRNAADRLAHEWRVPRDKDNNQSFVVSDKEQPMKPVVAGAIDLFLDTSRPQDRIVVYYGGHVVAKKVEDKDAAFLVPMEGDPEDVESLIPVADVFAKLKTCKATQKVVIWDVCRFNPERGRLRPGSEPMTEVLAKLLTEPAPAGVQVILTCQPGENALEFYNQSIEAGNAGKTIAGSAFLDLTRHVKTGGKNLGENDPIPVDDWVAVLGKKVSDVAGLASSGEKGGKFAQTVKVYGTAPQTLTASNKEESAAKRFDMPVAPKGASVADLVAEFALPPIHGDDAVAELGAFPFPAEVLAAYKADVSVTEMKLPANKGKYDFQLAVIESFDTMREVWGDSGRAKLRSDFSGTIDDRMKKDVTREQGYLADSTPKLDLIVARLEAYEPKKAAQSKRWQAHYDYALAHAKARLAYLHEYNLALGNIKTEVLPPRDAKLNQDGYKLVSSPTMKVKKEKVYQVEAHEIFDSMITAYKGTPWAIVAKRDRALSLGLAWQPYNSKGDTTMPDPPMTAAKE